jgi:hypothetical protein
MNFFLSVTNVAAAKQVELVCKTYHLAKRNLSFRRPKQVVLQMRAFLMNIFNIKRGDKRQENDVLKMFVTQCYVLTVSGLNLKMTFPGKMNNFKKAAQQIR